MAVDGQTSHSRWEHDNRENTKMEQEEIVPILKPCPFCGDRPQIVQTGTFRVQCADCGASGPPAPNMDRAAIRWNKRNGDDCG
jgi:Lar family restriction alleviation protein